MFDSLDHLVFDLSMPWPLVILVLFFGLIALAAVSGKALNGSGALAAMLLGLTVTWAFGFRGLALLFFFFLTSTLISKIRVRIQKIQDPFFEKKGSVRDAVQVAANGLGAFFAAVLYLAGLKLPALFMFGAALAEAGSDTWAGEVGRLSHKAPVSLKTGKEVPRGVSGGVTLLGTVTGFLASFVTALVFIVLFRTEKPVLSVFIVTIAGFTGCILDSVFGAFWQALYQDPETKVYAESPVSKDGKPLKLIHGMKWLDNDMVNIQSNAASAVIGLILGLLL